MPLFQGIDNFKMQGISEILFIINFPCSMDKRYNAAELILRLVWVLAWIDMLQYLNKRIVRFCLKNELQQICVLK